jgi:hypothetical protein
MPETVAPVSRHGTNSEEQSAERKHDARLKAVMQWAVNYIVERRNGDNFWRLI